MSFRNSVAVIGFRMAGPSASVRHHCRAYAFPWQVGPGRPALSFRSLETEKRGPDDGDWTTFSRFPAGAIMSGPMIAVSDLGKSFGPQTLFEGVSIQFNPGNRYGLVGAN